jgi:hypothetical protein
MKIWKYSGIFLLATGILHTIISIILEKHVYYEIIKDGFINVIGDNYERAFAFWFLICGLLIIIFGVVLHQYIRKEQRAAPAFLGYSILLLSVLGCLVEPVSGFWLFIPQALIIIFANRKKI